MRLLWLPDVLRAAGLTVHEVQGWRTRGSDSYGPVRGITCHETQGSLRSTDAGEIGVLLNGSATANPPIAQLYLSRSGDWHVVASGTCYHNKIGQAGPNKGYGNDALLGIEAQHAKGEPWTARQYDSYVRGVAALAAHKSSGYDVTVSRVGGHKEHQPGEKSDPGFDMTQFRRDVAAFLDGGDDVNTEQNRWLYNASSVVGHLAMGSDAAPVLDPDGKPGMLTIKRDQVTLSDEQLPILADLLAARMPRPPTAEEIASHMAAAAEEAVRRVMLDAGTPDATTPPNA